MRQRVVALVAVAAAFGGTVFFLAWQGHTLRLDPGGVDLAWPALVAFGVMWSARERPMRPMGSALILGAVVALVGFYASLKLLPVTPMGVGIGLGVAAALVAVMCGAMPRILPLAPAAIGFGAGIAASHLANITATTNGSDVLASVTATVTAMVVGMLAKHGLVAVESLVEPRSERPELTVISGEDIAALDEPLRRAR